MFPRLSSPFLTSRAPFLPRAYSLACFLRILVSLAVTLSLAPALPIALAPMRSLLSPLSLLHTPSLGLCVVVWGMHGAIKTSYTGCAAAKGPRAAARHRVTRRTAARRGCRQGRSKCVKKEIGELPSMNSPMNFFLCIWNYPDYARQRKSSNTPSFDNYCDKYVTTRVLVELLYRNPTRIAVQQLDQNASCKVSVAVVVATGCVALISGSSHFSKVSSLAIFSSVAASRHINKKEKGQIDMIG